MLIEWLQQTNAMACTFTISFQGTASTLSRTIRGKMQASNGQFNGDESAGNFSIHVLAAAIEGAYTINGNNLSITIGRKPFFVSCNAIKDYVTQNLTGPL